MTSTDLSTEQEEMWRTFFDDNHADLVIAAAIALPSIPRKGSPQGIIMHGELIVRGDLWTGNPRGYRCRH